MVSGYLNESAVCAWFQKWEERRVRGYSRAKGKTTFWKKTHIVSVVDTDPGTSPFFDSPDPNA
jgi:hypothetical protein